MSLWFWVPFGFFGFASLGCFVRSYAHLTPEARRSGSRLPLRGALARQDIFTPRGWQLRIWGWGLGGLALLVLIAAGILEVTAP